MNLELQKQVIKHILTRIGLWKGKDFGLGLIEPLNSEKFLLPKKLAFQIESNKFERPMWAFQTKVDGAHVKMMAVNLSTEDTIEYALLIQLDNILPYGLRLSSTEDDNGSFAFLYENKSWINASTMTQSQILLGVETLSDSVAEWNRLDDYSNLYKHLVEFLNFCEPNE